MTTALPRALVAGLLAAAATSVAAGQPSLVQAAKSGDRPALRALLQKSADVDATEGDGATALHWSSYRDDLESVDLLLRAGAKVDAANDLGATALWLASQNGSDRIVERLLRAGANPNLALISGETPLMTAARSGASAVVDRLAAAGAHLNARAARGQTALMWAVAQKHPAVVKTLIARGADVHARTDAWSQVMAVPPHGRLEYNRSIPHGADSALMFAARVGDVASARLLVAAGANVNDADAWGVSALVMAAHSGFADVVDFLLASGADARADAAGFSALHAAVMRRDEKMVAALLAHRADPNARLSAWTPTRRSSKDWHFPPELVGATPLWLAARFAEPAIMRLLLGHGADPRFVHEVAYHEGESARPRTDATTTLMAAVGMGGGAAWIRPARVEAEARVLEAAELVVDLGADITAATPDGRTALDGARSLKYERVVKFLLEKGAR